MMEFTAANGNSYFAPNRARVGLTHDRVTRMNLCVTNKCIASESCSFFVSSKQCYHTVAPASGMLLALRVYVPV